MIAHERRVELPGSERPALPGARRTGPWDPSTSGDVTLLLRRGGTATRFPSLAELGARRGAGKSPPSREAYAAERGARADDLEAVRRFARTHGLRVGEVSAARRTVHLEGTVGALAEAFGVELSRWEYAGGAYRGSVGPLRLPADLARGTLAVLGLDNRPQAKTHFRQRPPNAAAAPAYTPLEVAAAYTFPPGSNGAGQCIALLELGGGYRPADLTQYFATLGVPEPSITAVSVDGASNTPTGDPNGPDGEVELDVEVAGAIAPGATIVVYFAPNTDQGFLDALSTAVHDTTHRPTILSVSWGGPESSWTAAARSAFESIFEDAATLGVTVLAAAGDDGADDGGPGTGLSVDFPASSPAVIACGGTRLVLSGTSIESETVWNELAAGEGATGGGVSEDFALPSYQTGARVPAAPNAFVGRGVPDVAGDADPTTGYQVLVDGTSTAIGGTSAVAPLWAALVARLNQAMGAPLGYLNPTLYAAGPAATFHEITSGNNDGYSAGPGWNPCAGLGSPNGVALLQALRGV
ncbi:MAG: S53 family peptidase [Thermoplasmata archaeon]